MTSETIVDALFAVTAVGYVITSSLFLRFLVRGEKDIGRLAPRVMALSVATHAAHLLAASFVLHVCPVEGVHFPMSLASVLMGAAYVFARRRFRIDVAGAFIAPLALASLLASRFVGGGIEPTDRLKGAVLPFHVTVNLLGVAFFGLAFSSATLYLLQERLVKQKRIDGVSRRLPPLDALDRAEHRFLLAGFPLLTIGILTGTVWARRVELGATSDVLRMLFGYISWLVIAGVLFLRSVAGWRGRRAAYGTIAGFAFSALVLVGYLVRKEPAPIVTDATDAAQASTSSTTPTSGEASP